MCSAPIKKRPYYIDAPPYRRTSNGILILHRLCHELNNAGYEAYVSTNITNPDWWTPTLTDEVRARHKASQSNPIGIYPEIRTGNPFATPVVVRYLLNYPGLLGGPENFHASDYLLAFTELIRERTNAHSTLFMQTTDRSIFNNLDNPFDDQRQGHLIYPGRHNDARLRYPALFDNTTVITSSWPEDHSTLAALFRKSERLYLFEPSNLAVEAVLCGCPAIILPSPLFDGQGLAVRELGHWGMAFDECPESILEAKETLAKLTESATKAEICFPYALNRFITISQSLPLIAPEETQTEEITLDYQRFLYKHAQQVTPANEAMDLTHVTLICQVSGTNTGPLADTLDHLAALPPIWQLVVIADLPAPIELDEIGCIHWLQPLPENHTGEVSANSSVAPTDRLTSEIFKLVGQLDSDWIIEAPPGTRFEQSLFSALFQVDRNQTRAVFADNDFYNSDNQRHAPRFKPGVNPAALMSADLAGPICITRDAWLTLHRNPEHPAPWLSSLWQVANEYGWHSIKHLPQVLFSLPDSARHTPPNLMVTLEDELAKLATPAKLQAINPTCWALLWPLPPRPPSVHIFVQTDGDIGLIERCLEAIGAKTNYPAYSVGLLVSHQVDTNRDPDLDDWLDNHQANNPQTSQWRQAEDETYASFLNRALATINSDFTLFIADELVALQADWLNELVRACQPTDVVAASPRLIQPQTGHIENCGYVLGLQGWRGSAYFRQARVQTPDDFDWIDASRDITTLTTTCALIRTKTLYDLGGFNDLDAHTPGLNSGFGLMLADFSLRCFKNGRRIIYAPRATLAGSAEPVSPKRNSLSTLTRQILADEARFNCFKARWWPEFANDPFWNPNLSLVEHQPTLETDYFADWTVAPAPVNKPKILAHVLANAQADFRITDALGHLKSQGRVSTCVWVQRIDRPLRLLTASEIIRLSPDTHIVQNYVNEPAISALDNWFKIPQRPFTVLALDDVASAIDPSSPFYKNFSPDTRSRMSYALARCDRMVVSTEFLAGHYRNFIKDIRVVPNRLDMGKWLHLAPRKGRGPKVRIGWAGGTTHQRDLMLLKEVIEQTRDEADWIFFGMCPPEIAPLLAESHPFVAYGDYPTFLANLELDLAVAPLADNLFNRGKSNLRLLELGILGLPVVCTDIDPYQNSPACRVKNSVAAWVSALRERIHDRDAREREGLAMRQWVLQNYLLDNHLDEWLDAHMPG